MTDFCLDIDLAHQSVAGLGTQLKDDYSVRENAARIVWNHLTEPGDGIAGLIVDAYGAADGLDRLVADARGGYDALSPLLDQKTHSDALRRWLPRLSQQAVSDTVALARRRGIALVVPGDDGWPLELGDLGVHAPICLWVRGTPSLLRSSVPQAAIVGARAATAYGEHVAMELASELAASGVAIVSGAAYGIDGAAHRAALIAGGTTIALMAGGVDRSYPAGHTQLLDRIAETGVVASETPPGSAPTKWRFLQRNRIIAALASATVVVEAGWRSGSLNTAGHAAQLCRPLGAVPGPITSATSAGCHRLFREFGAQCVTSASDVRELLGMSASDDATAVLDLAGTDDTTRVLDALSARVWRETADVARRAGMIPEEVEAALGMLTLDAKAERSPRGWRRNSER
ncbi:DNA-processing protein DprA [Microbacterium sp. R86528]|uniref:DNA-processing protein DprA n=1 Tax=Microbacterium sp. R86528 TaxID=3093864 RepID=UPI0037CB363F